MTLSVVKGGNRKNTDTFQISSSGACLHLVRALLSTPAAGMNVHPGEMFYLLLCSSCPGAGGEFVGATVTPGEVFHKEPQEAGLCCGGTE